jgi:hypothetical protein
VAVQVTACCQKFGDEAMIVVSTFMTSEPCISEMRKQEVVDHEIVTE